MRVYLTYRSNRSWKATSIDLLLTTNTSDTGEFASPKVEVPTKFRESVIKLAHESLLSFHLGIYPYLVQHVFWNFTGQVSLKSQIIIDHVTCHRKLDKGRVT